MKKWKKGDKFYYGGCCKGYYKILEIVEDELIVFNHFPIATCYVHEAYETEGDYIKHRIKELKSEIDCNMKEIKRLKKSLSTFSEKKKEINYR